MHLYNLQNLRQSKRISRKTLGDYLNIDPKLVKSLETLDLEKFIEVSNLDEDIVNDLISTIADYLDVRVIDLVMPCTDIANNNFRKALAIFKINITEDVDDEKIKKLFEKVLENNNSKITDKNLEMFVAELKYRFSDIDNEIANIDYKSNNPRSFKDFIKNLEFEENNISYISPFDKTNQIINSISFYLDDDIGFDKKRIENIRKDARTAATIYKELVANKLPHEICIDILTAMLQVLV